MTSGDAAGIPPQRRLVPGRYADLVLLLGGSAAVAALLPWAKSSDLALGKHKLAFFLPPCLTMGLVLLREWRPGARLKSPAYPIAFFGALMIPLLFLADQDLMHLRGDDSARYSRYAHRLFARGDQDALVYLTETQPRFGPGFIRIVEHDQFNNRDFKYRTALSEHFLVHFTGGAKPGLKEAFCRRLGVNDYLIPEDDFKGLNLEAADMTGRFSWSGALRRLLRPLSSR